MWHWSSLASKMRNYRARIVLGSYLLKRQPFQDGKRLDDWLRIVEEVAKDIGIVYRSSFRLLESNNFEDESILDLFRTLYTLALAEVDAAKRERERA